MPSFDVVAPIYWSRLTTQKEGGFLVSFADLPEVIAQGDDEAEALHNAQDALEEALAQRIKRREAIPAAGKRPAGRARLVAPGSLMQAKAALWLEMLRQKVSPSALAAQMGRPRQDVTRLLDPKHGTNHRLLDAAFRALDRRVALHIEAA